GDGNQYLSQYLLSHAANHGVLIPSGFTQDYLSNTTVNVIVYTNPADTSSPIVYETVNGIVTSFNAANSTRLHSIGINRLNIKSQTYKYIDFLIPGLVGFVVLTNPI